MSAAVLATWAAQLHHPLFKQLLWLVLWACMSFSSMFANRVLIHYRDFAVPWFLALLSAAAVALLARVLVFLNIECSSSERKDWLHLSAMGVLMWGSVALSAASLQSLPVPVVILLQAAGPAVSYWLAVLMLLEDVQWASGLKAFLAFSCVTAAVLPHRAMISTAGLALQGSAIFLDVLWQRLHLRSFANSPSTADVSRTSTGLILLSDSAPAAVLVLLPAMLKFDLWQWQVQQFRLRAAMPVAIIACMLICCLMVLKAQAAVLQGLTLEPSGPLVRTGRDALLGLVAAKLLNEQLDAWQWLLYAVAQLASMALWAGSSAGNNNKLGFTKLLPILG